MWTTQDTTEELIYGLSIEGVRVQDTADQFFKEYVKNRDLFGCEKKPIDVYRVIESLKNKPFKNWNFLSHYFKHNEVYAEYFAGMGQDTKGCSSIEMLFLSRLKHQALTGKDSVTIQDLRALTLAAYFAKAQLDRSCVWIDSRVIGYIQWFESCHGLEIVKLDELESGKTTKTQDAQLSFTTDHMFLVMRFLSMSSDAPIKPAIYLTAQMTFINGFFSHNEIDHIGFDQKVRYIRRIVTAASVLLNEYIPEDYILCDRLTLEIYTSIKRQLLNLNCDAGNDDEPDEKHTLRIVK